MHDPTSPETQTKEDGDKSNLESKQSTTTNEKGKGSQTQQTMNGGNDVVMADVSSTGGGGNDNQQSAPTVAKMNGEAVAAAVDTNGSANAIAEEKKTAENTNGIKSEGNEDGAAAAATAPAPAAAPPPPVLRGTLSYNIDLRRHLIRGMWNYENSNAFPPQRFELVRNLGPTEDPTELPKDGEFHGSFSLAYYHTTSKGKQKERSKVIPESGVNIKFTKIDGGEGGFKVDGKGTNQFGIFHINGTANLSPHDDGQYQIVLRKRYEPSAQAAAPAESDTSNKKSKKRKMGNINGGTDGADKEDGPLPPPSQSYESNVVCLRGKLYKEESEELGVGVGDIVHRIHGMWSSGLDLILADPQNVNGLCNRFEYEHKSSNSSSSVFPVSGRYSGWFDLNLEDGSKKKISEKDVTLRFRKNNAGYHNVEGKGSNAFGKYSITGTLTMDNVITIFRHFQAKKVKAPRPVTSAPPPINAPGQARKPSLPAIPDPQLKLDEVKVPDLDEKSLEPLTPPEHSTYSAISRGVLRLTDDGSHTCNGKWAVTREHFNNGQTSEFRFRLEAHFAADAEKKAGAEKGKYPLDSEMYKGSFQLKKGAGRTQTIIDQQIVMKFRKNSAGSYNVYGKGVNGIGVFNLTGTLIVTGAKSGHVEVYRVYPPEMLAAPAPAPKNASTGPSIGKTLAAGMPDSELPPTKSMAPSASTMLPGPPRAGVGRRESTRLVKVPSRLEDDDPDAQLVRIMDKCNLVLRFIREKDVERGAYFSEPVDPVALGIPTYHQVITEPMDLRTLHRKMEAGEVTTPEDFGRLVRLVFENAMTFNVDPTHSVHQAARNLLILFNQKYRDIERMVTTIRRGQKGPEKKNEKKRKRGGAEPPKSLKRQRLDEAQEMAAANASALNAIVAAAPSGAADGIVTRNEFSLMLHMIQQLQQQVVQTYTVLADTLSDEVNDETAVTTAQDLTSAMAVPSTDVLPPVAPPPEKKRQTKKKEPKVVEKQIEEDSRPLSLQEQELLTETINDLPEDHLHGVIQIIRDAAGLSGEEDEIDLEIDQLDAMTQRKLLRHVSKFIKKPKQKAKAPKKARAAPAPAPAPIPKKEKPPPAEKKNVKSTTAVKKENPDSFFAFGPKVDSDSDSDGEITSPGPAPAAEANETASTPAAASASKDQGFSFGGGADSDEEDNDEDMDEVAPAASWSLAKPATESQNNDDDDDEFLAAREEAAAAEARDKDRKKREEKVKAEAEQAKLQSLADAVNRGEEIKAQKRAEEEVEAQEREKKEKEAEEQRRAAREAARAQVQAVQQTVDLDAQRDIMEEFEQSFMEKEAGSASPSSDFGF